MSYAPVEHDAQDEMEEEEEQEEEEQELKPRPHSQDRPQTHRITDEEWKAKVYRKCAFFCKPTQLNCY
jgi:hypothetical protein